MSEEADVNVKAGKKKRSFGTTFKDFKGGWSLFLTMLISLLIMAGVCVAVFFVAVQGEEQVRVPNVEGKSLVAAQLELQDKQLFPELVLTYSELPGDEGIVLSQNPAAGSIVKAFRHVTLTVSRGVPKETLEDYLGQQVDEVQKNLQLLFAGSKLVTLAPPVYQKSEKPEGTILAQFPVRGTSLDDKTRIFFIVSSGDKSVEVKVPEITGYSVQQIFAQMSSAKVIFDFTSRTAAADEKSGIVVSQGMANETVPEFSRVPAEFAFPVDTEEAVTAYGIFSHTLPDYPYPVPVKLETTDQDGNTTTLVEFSHPGKELSIPYAVKKGSSLTLYALDSVVTTQTVQ
ncbi:MAG TPA: penicillin-binding protein [Treponema sp.]|jgi:beta-lactam-binding protein with PASTA domain|nr:penicillin-binding protein [Treponema sp.]HBB42208.1 penicillin-binding protein [Treponema sp.]